MRDPNRTLALPDGRALGLAEYGDSRGIPLFFFPGTPGSRLIHPPDEVTRSCGVRLIALERPGFGLSRFQRRRKLLNWPRDVAACADALGLDRFAVVGLSGGGPYALACAYRLPHRVTAAAVIGGVGPVDVPGGMDEMPRIRQVGAMVARYMPWMLRPLLWLTSNPHRDPERFYARMCAGVSDVDRAVLARPEMKAQLMASYLEATRQGMHGFAREAIILSSPWGFRLEDVRIPVHLWHGEADHNVSLSAARHMAHALPDCRATFLPDEGHWLILTYWDHILSGLIGAQRIPHYGR
jgi:pimeloyl-ACP methyl ester carboxylesterase